MTNDNFCMPLICIKKETDWLGPTIVPRSQLRAYKAVSTQPNKFIFTGSNWNINNITLEITKKKIMIMVMIVIRKFYLINWFKKLKKKLLALSYVSWGIVRVRLVWIEFHSVWAVKLIVVARRLNFRGQSTKHLIGISGNNLSWRKPYIFAYQNQLPGLLCPQIPLFLVFRSPVMNSSV